MQLRFKVRSAGGPLRSPDCRIIGFRCWGFRCPWLHESLKQTYRVTGIVLECLPAVWSATASQEEQSASEKQNSTVVLIHRDGVDGMCVLR